MSKRAPNEVDEVRDTKARRVKNIDVLSHYLTKARREWAREVAARIKLAKKHDWPVCKDEDTSAITFFGHMRNPYDQLDGHHYYRDPTFVKKCIGSLTRQLDSKNDYFPKAFTPHGRAVMRRAAERIAEDGSFHAANDVTKFLIGFERWYMRSIVIPWINRDLERRANKRGDAAQEVPVPESLRDECYKVLQEAVDAHNASLGIDENGMENGVLVRGTRPAPAQPVAAAEVRDEPATAAAAAAAAGIVERAAAVVADLAASVSGQNERESPQDYVTGDGMEVVAEEYDHGDRKSDAPMERPDGVAAAAEAVPAAAMEVVEPPPIGTSRGRPIVLSDSDSASGGAASIRIPRVQTKPVPRRMDPSDLAAILEAPPSPLLDGPDQRLYIPPSRVHATAVTAATSAVMDATRPASPAPTESPPPTPPPQPQPQSQSQPQPQAQSASATVVDPPRSSPGQGQQPLQDPPVILVAPQDMMVRVPVPVQLRAVAVGGTAPAGKEPRKSNGRTVEIIESAVAIARNTGLAGPPPRGAIPVAPAQPLDRLEKLGERHVDLKALYRVRHNLHVLGHDARGAITESDVQTAIGRSRVPDVALTESDVRRMAQVKRYSDELRRGVQLPAPVDRPPYIETYGSFGRMDTDACSLAAAHDKRWSVLDKRYLDMCNNAVGAAVQRVNMALGAIYMAKCVGVPFPSDPYLEVGGTFPAATFSAVSQVLTSTMSSIEAERYTNGSDDTSQLYVSAATMKNMRSSRMSEAFIREARLRLREVNAPPWASKVLDFMLDSFERARGCMKNRTINDLISSSTKLVSAAKLAWQRSWGMGLSNDGHVDFPRLFYLYSTEGESFPHELERLIHVAVTAARNSDIAERAEEYMISFVHDKYTIYHPPSPDGTIVVVDG